MAFPAAPARPASHDDRSGQAGNAIVSPPGVSEAKARLRRAAAGADVFAAVRRRPLTSVGLAFAAGLAVAPGLGRAILAMAPLVAQILRLALRNWPPDAGS